jgi:murein DD-endopeptidase MepM/ murein hydrolase activator NlpD
VQAGRRLEPVKLPALMSGQFRHLLGIVVIVAACHEAPAPARPHRLDVVLHRETETVDARVPAHATLDTLLKANQVAPALVQAAVASARRVFDPRHLRADRPYRLVRSLDGLLREFHYQIDADRELRIVSRGRAEPESLDAEVVPYAKETSVLAIHGRIDAQHSSVVAAIDTAGENIQLAMALAEIFAGEIDFDSDLRPGDGFEVLFEKSVREGQFAGYGAILGARFDADGRQHQAFRWVDPASGKAAFYDENGRSLKRFFLRSPLKFEPRVTSGFSRSRLHPVLRTYRAHLGVDYAAPPGAPVVAVSSGTVISAGWSGAGGNMVRIRHASGFESFYLHLSGFGPGIHPSVHVSQGQLIGRVGSTGLATGPHLDYRLKKNGEFVDPLAVHRKLPPGDPIPVAAAAGFRAVRDRMLNQIATTPVATESAPHRDAIPATR